MKISKVRLHKNKNKIEGVFFEADGKNCYEYLDWVDREAANSIDPELIVRIVDYPQLWDTEGVFAVKPFEEMTESELISIIKTSIEDSHNDLSVFTDYYKEKVKHRAYKIGLVSLKKSISNIYK